MPAAMHVGDVFMPADGWGPDRRRAALSISFDNLGEAAWLEMGLWGDAPVGAHYTADFVPRLIDTLGDVRATYFIEASNAAIYPAAIRCWHDAGHEVGIHAWRHEAWDRTPADRRRDILTRSLAAMHAIDIDPVGFRPPGGAVPVEAYAEFEAAGFRYCSDLGAPGVRRVGGLTRLPFAWANVDSYILEPVAAPLRRMFGDAEVAGTIADWQAHLDRMIDAALVEGGQRTVIFHPEFIGVAEDKLAMVRWLIARAKAADMWIARACDVAAFVKGEMSAETMIAAE